MQQRTILSELVFLDPEKPHNHSQTTSHQAGNCYQHCHGTSFLDFKVKGFWITQREQSLHQQRIHLWHQEHHVRCVVALLLWTFFWGDSLGPKANECHSLKCTKRYVFLQLTLWMKRGAEPCIEVPICLAVLTLKSGSLLFLKLKTRNSTSVHRNRKTTGMTTSKEGLLKPANTTNEFC